MQESTCGLSRWIERHARCFLGGTERGRKSGGVVAIENGKSNTCEGGG